MADSEIKLTQYAHAAGCGCKMAPADLEKLLVKRTQDDFSSLLVGNQTSDDAAVWDLGNGQAMINTVDFFMPIVDSPFDFGRIASANAISDVYAMGGKPLFANAILGWPVGKLPVEMAAVVLEGAREICAQAGIPLAGGHSIDSLEPLFGLSVSGVVGSDKVIRNSGGKPGDLLFLTKPIGTGIVSTAQKRGIAEGNHLTAVIESMCRLNTLGSRLGEIEGVHALTDLTGFGLTGHLIELCGNSLSAQIFSDQVPVFPFLTEYLNQNCIPDNTYRNWNAVEKKVSGVLDMSRFQLFNDPQTSGGLLIAVSENSSSKLIELMHEFNLDAFAKPIGKLLDKMDEFTIDFI